MTILKFTLFRAVCMQLSYIYKSLPLSCVNCCMLWQESEAYSAMGKFEHDGLLFWKQWLYSSIMGLFPRIWQIFYLLKYFARVCSLNLFLSIIIIIIVLPGMYTVSHFGLMYSIVISVYWMSCKHWQRHCIDCLVFCYLLGRLLLAEIWRMLVLIYLYHMLYWFLFV